MTYKECLDSLKDYEVYWGKTVEFNGELFKVAYPLICPIDQPQFSIYLNYYLKEIQPADKAITQFVNDDLQIVLKANRLSDDSLAFLEPIGVTIIS